MAHRVRVRLRLVLGFVDIRVRVSVRVRFVDIIWTLCGHVAAANCGRLRLQPTEATKLRTNIAYYCVPNI